jgi:hypothetical protein
MGCKTFGMISEVGLINDCPLQHLSLNCSSISVIYKITLDPLVHNTVFVFYQYMTFLHLTFSSKM